MGKTIGGVGRIASPITSRKPTGRIVPVAPNAAALLLDDLHHIRHRIGEADVVVRMVRMVRSAGCTSARAGRPHQWRAGAPTRI